MFIISCLVAGFKQFRSTLVSLQVPHLFHTTVDYYNYLRFQDIVDQLVENSATFKGKTEFAQQKYIKKKKKKYQNKFIVLKPTIRLIAEMYFNKGPTKIG